MSDLRIIRLRVELYAAAQLLKGDDLDAFRELLDEVHSVVHVLDEPQPTRADLARVTAERDAAVRERDEAANLDSRDAEVISSRRAWREAIRERDGHRASLNTIANALGVVHEDPKIVAAALAAIRESRRPGLTLTAEERAALEEMRLGLCNARGVPGYSGAWLATIDRLLAGARTVTAADVERWATSISDVGDAEQVDRERVRAILADIGIEVTP